MKNITLFIVLILIGFTSIIAQPVLDQSNFVYTYTDSVVYIVADSSSILDTTTGANVVFDYTKLRTYGLTQTGYYVNPATTSGVSDFPSANLAENSSVSTQNYVYTFNSADSVTNLGFIADVTGFGLTTAKYNIDPEATMRFPFSYGDNYTDNYAGSFSANVTPVGLVSTNASGSVTIHADAWGTLIFSSTLSLDSVVRVKRVESMVTDPIILSPLPNIPPITVNATMISYYKPNVSKAPILSFVYGSYTQNGTVIDSTNSVVSKYPIAFVSVEEINTLQSVDIYPNPTKNNSTLMIETEKSVDINVQLLNALGQKVLQVINNKMSVGKNQFLIDTSKMPSGIYFVTISLDGKMTSSRKLVVE
ncbi:MAG: T9SS type A sorting domain-containing protein [Flavobacteriales bacterium]